MGDTLDSIEQQDSLQDYQSKRHSDQVSLTVKDRSTAFKTMI